MRPTRIERDRSAYELGYWRPDKQAELPAELAALADADVDSLLHWVGEHGLFGTGNGDAFSDSIEAIRWELAHLSRCRALLAALAEPTPDIAHLTNLMIAVDEQVQPAATVIGYAWRGDAPPDTKFRRADSSIDLQALDALGRALSWGFAGDRLTVHAVVVGNDRKAQLRPGLFARGPIAAAYLRTLYEATGLIVNVHRSQPRLDWKSRRLCAYCNKVSFSPRTRKQAWCSPRCRYLAWTAKPRVQNPWEVSDVTAT